MIISKNYNSLERFDDADNCYFQYRTIRRKKHLKGKISKIFDYIAWLAYGYGVRPIYPLAFIFGLFLISIPIFITWFESQEPLNHIAILNSTVESFYLSITVLTSSPKTELLVGYYRLWGVIERIAGWLLMASFLVVLARKTIR